MTFREFEAAMKPIFETFGAIEYPPVRVKLIFDEVSDLSEFEFRSIVKHFCKTKSVKYPPLPTHFNEEAQGQRKLRLDRQVERVASSQAPRQEGSLERVMGLMGAKSIVDAVWNPSHKNNAGTIGGTDK